MAYSKFGDGGDILAEVHAVRSDLLGTLVLRQIRRMILSGELRPGDTGNEVASSRSLGMSRGPVREASRQLVQVGLLEAQVQRGTFVKTISFEEVEVLYEIRIALYGLAGRLLATRIRDAEIARLDDIITRIEQAYESGDVAAYYPLSYEMHECLLNASGNRKLRESYFDCWHQIRLFRLGHLPRDDSFPELATKMFREALDGRKKTLEAIRSRDPKIVSKAMKDLTSASWNRTRRFHSMALENADICQNQTA